MHVKTLTTHFFQHYSADVDKFLYTASSPKISKNLLCFAVAAKKRYWCYVNGVVFLWCQGMMVFLGSGEVQDVSLERVSAFVWEFLADV